MTMWDGEGGGMEGEGIMEGGQRQDEASPTSVTHYTHTDTGGGEGGGVG